MQDGPSLFLTFPAAAGARSQRPDDDGAWFCLDGHLWLPRPPDLTTWAAPAKGSPPTATATEITFDLPTLRLQAATAPPARWSTVPEAQDLLDRVLSHLRRALATVSPAPRGALPGAAAVAMPLPALDWPDPVSGWFARLVRWLRRRTAVLTGTLARARMRSTNQRRNAALRQFEAGLAPAAPDTPTDDGLPHAVLARLARRIARLEQPMAVQAALTMAPDRAHVTVEMAQSGRIDLVAGIGTLQRRHDGLDLVRLDGDARDQAIRSHLLARLVAVARCAEAASVTPPRHLSATLALADLPETRAACLTVGPRGWGLGLAELALVLPEVPDDMPAGLSFRMLPADRAKGLAAFHLARAAAAAQDGPA
ncbi:MAG: hypothetical protein ACT4OK_15510 [Gemmobacter sp.]